MKPPPAAPAKEETPEIHPETAVMTPEIAAEVKGAINPETKMGAREPAVNPAQAHPEAQTKENRRLW